MKRYVLATSLLVFSTAAGAGINADKENDLLLKDCERAMTGASKDLLEMKQKQWLKAESRCEGETITLASNLLQEEILRWRNFRELCLHEDDVDVLRMAHERIRISRKQTRQSMTGAVFDDASCLSNGKALRPKHQS